MSNHDIVVFDKKGNQLTGEGLPPPLSREFDKTVDADYAEFYERGIGFVWHKLPSTRQLVLAGIVVVTFCAIILVWVLKDSQKTKEWYQNAVADRTARGCKYVNPEISPDPPAHKDDGCRPVQK